MHFSFSIASSSPAPPSRTWDVKEKKTRGIYISRHVFSCVCVSSCTRVSQRKVHLIKKCAFISSITCQSRHFHVAPALQLSLSLTYMYLYNWLHRLHCDFLCLSKYALERRGRGRERDRKVAQLSMHLKAPFVMHYPRDTSYRCTGHVSTVPSAHSLCIACDIYFSLCSPSLTLPPLTGVDESRRSSNGCSAVVACGREYKPLSIA